MFSFYHKQSVLIACALANAQSSSLASAFFDGFLLGPLCLAQQTEELSFYLLSPESNLRAERLRASWRALFQLKKGFKGPRSWQGSLWKEGKRILSLMRAQPLGKFLSFLEDPRTFEGRGRTRGLRRFRKAHLENIPPRGSWDRDPRYPTGVPRDQNIFLKKFLFKSY